MFATITLPWCYLHAKICDDESARVSFYLIYSTVIFVFTHQFVHFLLPSKSCYWWLEKQADSWRNHMAGMQILQQYRTLVLWTPIQPDSLFPYIFLEVGTTVRFWGLWNFGTTWYFKNITLFALQRCASKASKTGRLCAVQSLSTTRLCYTFFFLQNYTESQLSKF